MSQVMEHVHQLAEVIGPRPAATDAEANAADYIEDVFRVRGLEVERQEFDCPRTTTWPYVLCHVLTLAAVALTFWLPVAALVPAVIAAAALVLELSGRGGFSRVLPKGPSQNIIARHVPRQRRGERLKRVVIMAHYDSSKPSLVTGPGASKFFGPLNRAALLMTVLAPAVIAFAAMPFAADWKPWTGVAVAVVSGGVVVPLFVGVHRELFMRATDGAGGSAAGIAALFSVMEATVPEAEEAHLRSLSLRRESETSYDADIDETALEYRPLDGFAPAAEALSLEGFGDVDWETGRLPSIEDRAVPAAAEPPFTPGPASLGGSDMLAAAPVGDWADDSSVGSLWDDDAAATGGAPAPLANGVEAEAPETASWRDQRPASARPAPSPVPARWDAKPVAELPEDDETEGQESFAFEPDEGSEREEPVAPTAEAPADEEQHGHGLSAWLGIGRGFDVRKAGKKIGTWDNIDDDDEFGFKAGWAGEPAGADGEMADVAARIRRRVTEQVDRALVEKEIWFVATGADEAGLCGTKVLLDAYSDDLRDALIINLESVGAGTVAFVTQEGTLRTYRSDRRLVAQAKRTARDEGLSVKAHSYRSRETSASAALARHLKAMTVLALDINGRVPNWRWHTDVADALSEKTIEQAAEFVTALVRDL